MKVDHPNVQRAEFRYWYYEEAMKWKKALILYTDLKPSYENGELCEEIIGAGNRAMEEAGDHVWRVLIVGDEIAQGT